MPKLYLDLETYGSADLREVGAYVYAEHPDTRILLVAWAIDGAAPATWDPAAEPAPALLMPALADPGFAIVAHNAGFDRTVLRHKGEAIGIGNAWVTDPARWALDTMPRAAAMGLPQALGGAAAALGLGQDVQKDKDGARLIRLFSIPQPRSGAVISGRERPIDWLAFRAYSEQDIAVCRALDAALPRLTETEERVFTETERLNDRGVAVDLDAAQAISRLRAHWAGEADARCETLTGVRATQVGALRDWVVGQGVQCEALDSDVIDGLLAHRNLPPTVREVLEARTMVSNAALAKADAVVQRTSSDGRLRGTLRYLGAKTGRWTSSGVQLQNLKRPTIEADEQARVLGIARDHKTNDATDALGLLYRRPGDIIAQCVRGLLVPTAGRVFHVADFAKIELAVLWYISGETEAVDRLIRGEDEYKRLAAFIFNKPVESVTKSERNTVGKPAVLGCGFGMGYERFAASAGVDIATATAAVNGYRRAYGRVTALWARLFETMVYAIESGESLDISPTVPSLRWFRDGDFLKLNLPSGRAMTLHKPVATPVTARGQRTYDVSVATYTGKGVFRDRVYGGRLAEWAASSIARDLLADALLRIVDAGLDPVMLVHDEVVADAADGRLEELLVIMRQPAPWAEGWPIGAEGGTLTRYAKV
jgi:DNA polymerase